jgi:Ca2+-binding EF-hand superfamily protein
VTRFVFVSKDSCCFLVSALLVPALTITTNAVAAGQADAITQSPPFDNAKRLQVQTNFKMADVDKNDQLSMAEFQIFINLNADQNLGQAVTVRRFGIYTKAFKKLDANGDGILTKHEIATQVQQ